MGTRLVLFVGVLILADVSQMKSRLEDSRRNCSDKTFKTCAVVTLLRCSVQRSCGITKKNSDGICGTEFDDPHTLCMKAGIDKLVNPIENLRREREKRDV
ncbi:unnamed protein product [Enterobius vermicularis]|uniref:Secreted protein n=1 Tax=Enterobius vermicularis TaxID=51028 RepID=A0A0N4VI63_ENTVE|nr:unnamed protein product [Enterobius vermicularis]